MKVLQSDTLLLSIVFALTTKCTITLIIAFALTTKCAIGILDVETLSIYTSVHYCMP